MTNIISSILAINPKAEVTVKGDDVDTIAWLNGTKVISKAEILEKQKQLQKEYENNEYQRKRKSAYPSIEEQLDDLYHNGIEGWKTTIKAIKDKHPKP